MTGTGTGSTARSGTRVPHARINCIKTDRAPVGLGPRETPIIRLGRAILRDHKFNSMLYARVEKSFGREGLVELAIAIGDYAMVGMVMTTIETPDIW